MVTKRNSRLIDIYKENNENKVKELLELDADMATELPANGEFGGSVLAHGSIAHIITTGEFYCLGGDGKWYNQDDGSTPSNGTEQSAEQAESLAADESDEESETEEADEPEEVTTDAEPVQDAESK